MVIVSAFSTVRYLPSVCSACAVCVLCVCSLRVLAVFTRCAWLSENVSDFEHRKRLQFLRHRYRNVKLRVTLYYITKRRAIYIAVALHRASSCFQWA